MGIVEHCETENVGRERGVFLEEEGDFNKEYEAIHEDDFFCSWLRDDTEGKAEEVAEKTKKKWPRVGRER